MENYVKVVLYAYPLLKSVEEGYAEHIKNKALLSYNSSMTAENLAVYLAEEIIRKNKLSWLKGVVEKVVKKLNAEEQTLLSVRYFGKRRAASKAKNTPMVESERQYFRRQSRLSEKVAAMLKSEGLTEERYKREYSTLDIFEKVKKYVERREKKELSDKNARKADGF